MPFRGLSSAEYLPAGDPRVHDVVTRAYETLSQPSPEASLVSVTLEDLFGQLRRIRLSVPPDQWQEHVRTCRAHPLKALVHQDPFTYRAFSKPRGYAGDAEMIDYIYGREEHWAPPHTTPIGSYVFDYTTMSPASKGVRTRRGFVADLLDRLADEIPMPHVLSVAAGHLREVELSAAVKRRRLGRYAALDADPHSLALVERCYGRFGVETVAADIRELFTARRDIGQFDLVYTMGLYDYLPQRLGRRLAASLFRRLRRRGRLVIANFLPEIHDIGYMEAYMDWFLVYRNREEMVNLTMDIPQADLRDIILWSEENQNILFLEVKKA